MADGSGAVWLHDVQGCCARSQSCACTSKQGARASTTAREKCLTTVAKAQGLHAAWPCLVAKLIQIDVPWACMLWIISARIHVLAAIMSSLGDRAFSLFLLSSAWQLYCRVVVLLFCCCVRPYVECLGMCAFVIYQVRLAGRYFLDSLFSSISL